MDYNDIKSVIDTRSFYLLHKIINEPQCEVQLNFTGDSTGDPFDGTTIDATVPEPELLQVIDCIYTHDKVTYDGNITVLGSEYSIVLYMRWDDLLPATKNNLKSLTIKFNDVMYNITNSINLYNIIYQIYLK